MAIDLDNSRNPNAPRLPPATDAVPEQPNDTAREEVDDKNARILVVDDIDTNLEIVEAYLRENGGYHVECVNSGLEAIQMLGSSQFDLILMDVQMPFMDGMTATQRIRALPPPLRDIPIIAMTGNVLPRQVQACLDAGMNAHVGKPIERSQLYHNVRRCLPRTNTGKAVAVPFEVATFDAFVLAVGPDRANEMAGKLLESLSAAFNSTFEECQREAHGLINTAGVLGLDDLVAACRAVVDFAPSRDHGGAAALQSDLRRAKLTARGMLTEQLLARAVPTPVQVVA